MDPNSTTYAALLVEKPEGGPTYSHMSQLARQQLPPGDVTIHVAWSSVNFKDALSISGHPGVTRVFPHVPGVDAAGTVVGSTSPAFSDGESVIMTGFDFGARRWGGYAELTRVPADWVVRLPAGLTLREAMMLGTAGFTAAQCVEAIQHEGIGPSDGDVVVTGASGGVGTVAVALLARLGYRVTAVSGKPAAHDLLKQLGAAQVLARQEVDDRSDKPLLATRWSAVVDTVGGNILATLIRSTRERGCVTACGMVGGTDLPLSVYPFILRGVKLIGIDSASLPNPQRQAIWDKLAGPWKLDSLETLTHEIPLAGVPTAAVELQAGRVMGRTLVRIG